MKIALNTTIFRASSLIKFKQEIKKEQGINEKLGILTNYFALCI